METNKDCNGKKVDSLQDDLGKVSRQMWSLLKNQR